MEDVRGFYAASGCGSRLIAGWLSIPFSQSCAVRPLPRAEPFDSAGDVVEREDLVDAAGLDGFIGHAEDDGGLRRLGDGAAAAFADAADCLRAVIAHAGHDDGNHPFAAGVAGG